MQCDLPYIKAYADRHGRMRYYFRRRGYPEVALPGAPGSPEFLAAYQEANSAKRAPVAAPGVMAGSFDALCREYVASAEFSDLAVSTRREMGYVIEAMRLEHGPKPVKMLERRHIMAWKDKLKDKPGAANKMLRTVKILMGWAVLRGYRADNPADKIKMMKLGRHRAWTDGELAQFEAHWPLGTLPRAIFDLALYTGQRRADVARMRRSDVYGPNLHIIQRKTGKTMLLRVHANLAKSLAAFLPTHQAKTLIAGPSGTTLSPVYMAAIFRAAARDAGLPAKCVLHGLRKSTARVLAELGESSTPVTGHATRAMQEEYERDANQGKMASAAIIKWERAGKRKQAKAG